MAKTNKTIHGTQMKIIITEEQYNLIKDKANCLSPKRISKYIEEITPDKDMVPHYFLKVIKESKKKFCKTKLKIEDLLRSDADLREYVESGEKRYEDDDVDISDLDFPIVVLNGEVLDGYSRIAQHIDNGFDDIIGYVG